VWRLVFVRVRQPIGGGRRRKGKSPHPHPLNLSPPTTEAAVPAGRGDTNCCAPALSRGRQWGVRRFHIPSQTIHLSKDLRPAVFLPPVPITGQQPADGMSIFDMIEFKIESFCFRRGNESPYITR